MLGIGVAEEPTASRGGLKQHIRIYFLFSNALQGVKHGGSDPRAALDDLFIDLRISRPERGNGLASEFPGFHAVLDESDDAVYDGYGQRVGHSMESISRERWARTALMRWRVARTIAGVMAARGMPKFL